jgi:hypothetical protein
VTSRLGTGNSRTFFYGALPMRDIAAATCTDTLIAGWISRYGVPAQLTSDRGTQFTLAIWDALCEQLGIQHQPTTDFHPQASGMVPPAAERRAPGPPGGI